MRDTPPPGQPTTSQYSPDGRWYWDGWQWRPVPMPGPPWARPYAPPEGRSAAVVALLCLAIGAASLFVVSDGVDVVASGLAPGSIVEKVAAGFVLISIAATGISLVANSIAVPIWMHRVFRNLPALGEVDVRWSPAWAAGGWFIPFANLVIPFLVARELWNRTAGAPPPGWPVLTMWWGAWVAATVQLGVTNTFSPGTGNPVALFALIGLYEVCLLLAAVPLIVIVRHVARAQRARHAELLSHTSLNPDLPT